MYIYFNNLVLTPTILLILILPRQNQLIQSLNCWECIAPTGANFCRECDPFFNGTSKLCNLSNAKCVMECVGYFDSSTKKQYAQQMYCSNNTKIKASPKCWTNDTAIKDPNSPIFMGYLFQLFNFFSKDSVVRDYEKVESEGGECLPVKEEDKRNVMVEKTNGISETLEAFLKEKSARWER
ncbi:unnamed protein product [Orchesella dallaii]|uniref:Uncharacterized protein n=1 Tax=Orchesella dallaii TaxID=48710 RepID=A0ABP1S1D5_9HEXA